VPDYLGGARGVGGVLGLDASVVGAGLTAVGDAVGDPVMVCGDNAPDPSGSMTVVGVWPDGNGEPDTVALDVVVAVVVVVVVVGVTVVDVVGWTYVRGTQVYAGSGTNPGGTTCVSGAVAAGGGAWYALCNHVMAKNATISAAVDVRIRPLMM
jgi:hypothetical protein